ncbi:RZZ complex subunit Zw10 [Lasiodiplodia theobromae]|uniref:RZZ complex subunit Zw10 n=1 Tax=Lasiodiplodia theobromae TaxID=45133 RepID=A0A8H7IQ11_9PEZI|nr:RZZ complex subunit Zw10 [Lasiodiplodia theobromae]KAF4536706.1 RZZ complex subunit Zw10 [Lasiodiplodia theobromae]KAF9629853.1 RZZ complex subunit Zw10 [Lasiodiplodia theobromae]
MPPILTPQKLGQVVLESVEHGAYPDSEHVASAQLPRDAFPTLLAGIERARTEAEIRALSRAAAPDVDSWIAQAKQLQADIERSRATAHDIVQQAEAANTLHAGVHDASGKAALLKNELAFNDTLTATLERIKQASLLLDGAQNAALEQDILGALQKVHQVDDYILHLGPFRDTRVAGVLQKRANQLRDALAETANRAWGLLLAADIPARSVTVNDQVDNMTLPMVVDALSRLGTLDAALLKFQKAFEHAIVRPRLTSNRKSNAVSIADDTIAVSSGAAPSDVVTDVRHICEFLSKRLPASISGPVCEKLLPGVVSRLIADWLDPSIPVSLDHLGSFQDTLSSVSSLARYVEDLGWPCKELHEWVEKTPRNWLARRKEDALASVRELCSQGIRHKKEVERVETQMVSRDDAIMAAEAGEEADEGWDAWGNDEAEKTSEAAETKGKQGASHVEEEEMDADAWGLDDDAESKSEKGSKGNPEEEDTDAWGWGDDDEAADMPKDVASQEHSSKPNGETGRSGAQERELTLREKYTVTGIPDAIMEVITRVVADAQALAHPNFADSPVAPAAVGLYSIPTLILAMYRATAPVYYANDAAGNMLAYNDSTRLVDELRDFLARQARSDESSDLPPSSKPSSRLRLDADLKAIESFSKRAYGKEMESQRTILRDLLDGAQGFNNCTTAPFAAECDNAVSMTADRIRDVAEQWTGVLSHSALLQSLGSLLATVLNKMIVDIEDMSDISEEESKRLRELCNRVCEVSDLFKQPGQQGDMTGIYTPNWFKFQYLSEILEGTLADIKYLWTEGELKLEFEADEVVDLIEALFADSDHRRRAIADIRRTAR